MSIVARQPFFGLTPLLAASLLVGIAVSACGADAVDDAETSSDELITHTAWANPDWAERRDWYRTPQGSQLIEYDIFLSLERADAREPFVHAKNLSRLGFVYPPSGAQGLTDDARLPLGVVKDENQQGVYVGFTCAACHTGQIDVPAKQTRLVVEGGQSFLQLDEFLRELDTALTATLTNADKLTRFCDALGAARDACTARLDVAHERVAGIVARSASAVAEGPGRIDAIGRELNEVYSSQLASEPSYDILAPVSIPQVWDAPRLSCMQTNCASAAPLTRNLAEVFGVFGHTAIQHDGEKLVFDSSAKLDELHTIEQSLTHLPSPRWNEALFGSIDRNAAARGQSLYRGQCASCHTEPYDDDPEAFVADDGAARDVVLWKVTTTDYREVGTDSAFMDVHLNRKVSDPRLVAVLDQTVRKTAAEKLGLDPFGFFSSVVVGPAAAAARSYLRSQGIYGPGEQASAFYVYGALAEEVADSMIEARTGDTDEAASLREEYDLYRGPKSSDIPLTSYRARPLNGVAFTAPFGHNGAWPTLRDVLTPAAQRPTSFSVRAGSFDPKAVGLVTTGTAHGFHFDTSIDGNHNGGHEYGTTLSTSDKAALLEYLKSL